VELGLGLGLALELDLALFFLQRCRRSFGSISPDRGMWKWIVAVDVDVGRCAVLVVVVLGAGIAGTLLPTRGSALICSTLLYSTLPCLPSILISHSSTNRVRTIEQQQLLLLQQNTTEPAVSLALEVDLPAEMDSSRASGVSLSLHKGCGIISICTTLH
jgi:hypothetical protein